MCWLWQAWRGLCRKLKIMKNNLMVKIIMMLKRLIRRQKVVNSTNIQFYNVEGGQRRWPPWKVSPTCYFRLFCFCCRNTTQKKTMKKTIMTWSLFLKIRTTCSASYTSDRICRQKCGEVEWQNRWKLCLLLLIANVTLWIDIWDGIKSWTQMFQALSLLHQLFLIHPISLFQSGKMHH